MTKRNYRLPTPAEAGENYVPKPPVDDDGEECKRVLSVERRGRFKPMMVGEAEAITMDSPEAWDWVWRHRHPASAAVYAGITQLEARVVEG